MIFKCPQCGARTATPSSMDEEVESVTCGVCEMELTAAEHGTKVSTASQKRTQRKVLLGLLGAMALLFGGIMFPIGSQKARVRAKMAAPARRMTLAQLIANGPGGARHIELTGFRFGEDYIVEEFSGSWSRAWVFLLTDDDRREPAAIAELSGGGEAGIEATMRQSSLRGLVSARPKPFKATVGRKLYSSYPGVKADAVFYHIDQVAARPSEGSVTAFFTIGGVLVFVGVLLLVLAIVR